MALARLASKNLQQRACSSPTVRNSIGERAFGSVERHRWDNDYGKRFLATEGGDIKESQGNNEGGSEVAVSKEGRKRSSRLSRLLTRWPRRRSLWRDTDRDFSPALPEVFPSGLGNALMEATENMNRLFDNMSLTPFQLSARMKEQNECYKLKFDMPGISKDEVKITVDDGVLRIKGEHKEEDQEESDDEYWSSRSYGYYDTSLVLPDDAKVDDIKAELKHGVLNVTIPRTEKSMKDVKEVQVD